MSEEMKFEWFNVERTGDSYELRTAKHNVPIGAVSRNIDDVFAFHQIGLCTSLTARELRDIATFVEGVTNES